MENFGKSLLSDENNKTIKWNRLSSGGAAKDNAVCKQISPCGVGL